MEPGKIWKEKGGVKRGNKHFLPCIYFPKAIWFQQLNINLTPTLGLEDGWPAWKSLSLQTFPVQGRTDRMHPFPEMNTIMEVFLKPPELMSPLLMEWGNDTAKWLKGLRMWFPIWFRQNKTIICASSFFKEIVFWALPCLKPGPVPRNSIILSQL